MSSTLLSDASDKRNRKNGRGPAYVVSFLALLGGIAACTATATIGPASDSCSTNTSLGCVTGTTGFTCSGAAEPADTNADLICSTTDGTNYCCSTSSCNYDANVSCAAGSVGYSCASGGTAPNANDPTLVCTVSSANNVDEYCCSTTVTTTTAACTQSSTVTCVSGATGWSCTGTAQPQDTNNGLVCSTDGAGNFCCSTSSCNYDGTVTCVTGASGYSCATGATPPDGADPTLVCSSPTTASNIDEYCCYTNTTTAPAGATCAQDQSIAGCEDNDAGQPSYGFSCTGTDNPSSDFSGITCSTGTAGTNGSGASATLFCCVYN